MKRFTLITIGVLIGLFVIGEMVLTAFDLPREDFDKFSNILSKSQGDINYHFIKIDPILLWSLVPSVTMYMEGVGKGIRRICRITINSSGIRDDKEVELEKAPDTVRIACYGDSITFGNAVELENTWVKYLERRLKEKYPLKKIEVLNLGVPGYTSLQGLNYYKYRGEKFHPDIITVCFGANDVSDSSLPDAELSYMSLKYRMQVNPLERFRTLRTFKEFTGMMLPEKKDKLAARVSKEEYEKNMQEFMEITRERREKIVIIPSPYEFQGVYTNNYARNVRHRMYSDLLREIARKNNVPFVELPVGLAGDKSGQGLFFDTVHPNEEGCKVIAQKLYEKIAESGLIVSAKERG